MGTGTELHVLAVQLDELRDSQSRLHGEEQQGMVATVDPALAIGSGEKRFRFRRIEERHQGPLEAFVRDGQDALDERRMVRREQCRVAEQRVNGGQPSIAGAHAIVSLFLQVLEESADRRRIEVLEIEIGGGFSEPFLDESQEQAKGIALGAYGMGTGPALLSEPVGEEGFEHGSKSAHGNSPWAVSRRWAARCPPFPADRDQSHE